MQQEKDLAEGHAPKDARFVAEAIRGNLAILSDCECSLDAVVTRDLASLCWVRHAIRTRPAESSS
jgi:hypothetical protein